MSGLSPMMGQYLEIKNRYEDSILFFRLGDFYEMFFEDAKTVSEELDLVLTGKDCGLEERAPMCGVPFHSCEGYIARLVERGYKVAICEQVEDPAKAKGLVKRDVIRVITPGTVIEDSMLDESRNNYLACVSITEQGFGLCFADISTGETHITEMPADNSGVTIVNELMRFHPSELLISDEYKKLSSLSEFLKSSFEALITPRDKSSFDINTTENLILKKFSVVSVENIGLKANSPSASALGTLIQYINETALMGEISINKINVYTESQYMRLDMTAMRNLEISETMRSKSKKGSLLWVLDKTKTAMGKRLIRGWVEKPLKSIPEILLRQNAVGELASDTIMRGEACEYLSGIRDVDRIMSKVVFGSANARDLLSLSATAHKFPVIKQLLASSNSRLLRSIYDDIDELEDITELIDAAINEEAPLTLKEGKLIKSGYSEQVDRLRDDMENGTSYLSEMEIAERERTGIKNLKVRYNKVFGYYIEVTNSFLDKVPENYIRKQTLTNAERYITEELKNLETRVLSAKDRVFQLEYEIFDSIRKTVSEQLARFQASASAIAKLDVLCSLANVAVNNNYCCPLINNEGAINIKSGRHPVVEQLSSTPFVVNDTFLDKGENRCAIITGPNMAGKSTYMRQTALITLMAQIGSFVPAEMAEIGIVDAIFTRVGASDDLASGKSTFMVEMSEVADIIKNATKNSLLILDEIGRGTSTFDGMSIARAVLEYVADKNKLGAKSLFATHYHELTEMENEIKGVKNYNIAVKKRGDDIIFLRRIVRGGADESYGIEVAKLSGVPNSIIERAKAILKQTESEGIVTYKKSQSETLQISMESQTANELLKEMQVIDVNTLTPIEAMGILFDLINKAKSI